MLDLHRLFDDEVICSMNVDIKGWSEKLSVEYYLLEITNNRQVCR